MDEVGIIIDSHKIFPNHVKDGVVDLWQVACDLTSMMKTTPITKEKFLTDLGEIWDELQIFVVDKEATKQ